MQKKIAALKVAKQQKNTNTNNIYNIKKEAVSSIETASFFVPILEIGY